MPSSIHLLCTIHFRIPRIEDIAISGGTSRASHTANVYDSKMYVWGGEDSMGILNTLEYYNFLSNQWVDVGTGGTPRRGHSSVLYNNKLYFYGGEIEVDSEIELTDTVDIYDLALDKWTVGLPSGVPLVSHQAVIDGHRMWVWGGSKGSGIYSNDLYIYDLNANTWNQGQSGGTARRYHSAAAVNGILYFFGG